MNALLFSMPGTPVVYYGDEIGMGDNVYLGDRNGVRTPMQWSPDRNAGFSATNPQRLYLPVNIDPACHYETVNVESQQDNPNSLLNWTKRLIALRKQYKAFGRGTLEFLAPSNQRVIAYLRRYQQETILVVANLSRFAQAVQLDLHKYQSFTPVEMFGRTDFPAVGESYYPLTLGPNSFFWFSLEQREVAVTVATPALEASQLKLSTVFVPSLDDIWDENIRASIASVLPKFLQTRRWFRSKDRRFRSLEITEVFPIQQQTFQILFVRIEYTTGDPETYLIPVGFAKGGEVQKIREEYPHSLMAAVQGPGDQKGLLYSATRSPSFGTALIEAFAKRKRFNGERGSLMAQRNRQFRRLWGPTHPDLTPTVLASAEVNSSIKFGDHFVMKLLRNLEPGIHPGVELGEVLTEHQVVPFPNAAPFAGSFEYQPNSGGEKTTIAVLHGYVPNDGNAWTNTRKQAHEFLERALAADHLSGEMKQSAPAQVYALDFALKEPPPLAKEWIGSYLDLAERMGKRIAEMHALLAREVSDPAFAPEPFNDFYRQSLYHGYIALTGRRLEFLRQRYADMATEVRLQAAKVLEQEQAILAKLRAVFEKRIHSMRTRFHGRLHLGHLLITGDDVTIFDFEGDPAQHLSERRIKRCPLRDVASMLMSFGYAAQSALLQIAMAEENERAGRESLRPLGRFWYSHVSAAFIRGYWKVAQPAAHIPKTMDDQQTLLDTYLLERALLDMRADIQDKPELAGMSLRIMLHLLSADVEAK